MKVSFYVSLLMYALRKAKCSLKIIHRIYQECSYYLNSLTMNKYK